MRKILLLPLILMTFMSTSMHASWWSSDSQQQQQQIDQLHTQLDEQRQKDEGLGGVIIILGIGCVVALVVGAGMGSKARRAGTFFTTVMLSPSLNLDGLVGQSLR